MLPVANATAAAKPASCVFTGFVLLGKWVSQVVFVSHNTWAHAALKAFRIPKGPGIPIGPAWEGAELRSWKLEHPVSIKVEALSVAWRESASILFVSGCTWRLEKPGATASWNSLPI